MFCKIQYYYLKNNIKLENRWWALLDRLKLKDLKQLFKNSYFTKVFNALVEMQGLWELIQIGVLYRFLIFKYNKVCYSLLVYKER